MGEWKKKVVEIQKGTGKEKYSPSQQIYPRKGGNETLRKTAD